MALVHHDILTQQYSLQWYSGERRIGNTSLPSPVFPASRGVSLAARFGWHYLLSPLLELLLALLAINLTRTRFTVLVASSYCGALVGLLLRRACLVGKVVYWATDWVPFSRSRPGIGIAKLITFLIFQHGDKFCAEHCDRVWDATRRIGRARETRAALLGKPIRYAQYRVTHPPVLEIRSNLFQKPEQVTKKPMLLCVSRDLTEGNGIDLATKGLRSLPGWQAEITFVIASGSSNNLTERQEILDWAKGIGVEKQITIRGYVPMSELQQIAQNSTCGLSVFRDPNHVSNVVFPGKVVLYLELGLPIIVSEASALAREVGDWHGGVAIDCDFARAILEIQTHQSCFRAGDYTHDATTQTILLNGGP